MQTGAMSNAPLIQVELLEMPLALRDRALQHSDELLRELSDEAVADDSWV